MSTVDTNFTERERESKIKKIDEEIAIIESQIKELRKQRNEIEKINKYITDKQCTINIVTDLKKRVYELYHEGNFSKYYKSDEWNNLEHVFVGNRFCTYYYNDDNHEAGFYTNRISDNDILFHGLEKIEFDNYEAFKIAKSNLLDDEKFVALNKMFDSFLN